jgi:hypothetical protein
MIAWWTAIMSEVSVVKLPGVVIALPPDRELPAHGKISRWLPAAPACRRVGVSACRRVGAYGSGIA